MSQSTGSDDGVSSLPVNEPMGRGAVPPRVAILGSGIVSAAGRGGEWTMAAIASGGIAPAPPRTIVTELEDGPPVFEVEEGALLGFRGALPGGRGRRSLRLALVAAADAVNAA